MYENWSTEPHVNHFSAYNHHLITQILHQFELLDMEYLTIILSISIKNNSHSWLGGLREAPCTKAEFNLSDLDPFKERYCWSSRHWRDNFQENYSSALERFEPCLVYRCWLFWKHCQSCQSWMFVWNVCCPLVDSGNSKHILWEMFPVLAIKHLHEHTLLPFHIPSIIIRMC